MEHIYIELPFALLHGRKLSTGPEYLLAFHGFGQDCAAFLPLVIPLSPRYTIISFDLFYHGESRWYRQTQPLTKKQWIQIISRVTQELEIDRFSLAGFSLGGKVALATFELFPDRTDEMYLFAPDGIKTNFWYSLATYPPWIRTWFKSMVIRPLPFFRMVKLLRRFRLVDKSLLRFAEWQMSQEENRALVYYTWIVYRKLRFSNKKLRHLFIDHRVYLHLYIGAYDKIITSDRMKQFTDALPLAETITLETGHNEVIAEAAEFMQTQRKKT